MGDDRLDSQPPSPPNPHGEPDRWLRLGPFPLHQVGATGSVFFSFFLADTPYFYLFSISSLHIWLFQFTLQISDLRYSLCQGPRGQGRRVWGNGPLFWRGRGEGCLSIEVEGDSVADPLRNRILLSLLPPFLLFLFCFSPLIMSWIKRPVSKYIFCFPKTSSPHLKDPATKTGVMRRPSTSWSLHVKTTRWVVTLFPPCFTWHSDPFTPHWASMDYLRRGSLHSWLGSQLAMQLLTNSVIRFDSWNVALLDALMDSCFLLFSHVFSCFLLVSHERNQNTHFSPPSSLTSWNFPVWMRSCALRSSQSALRATPTCLKWTRKWNFLPLPSDIGSVPCTPRWVMFLKKNNNKKKTLIYSNFTPPPGLGSDRHDRHVLNHPRIHGHQAPQSEA